MKKEIDGSSYFEDMQKSVEGLDEKNLCFFIWLCSVRVLPFLCTKSEFDFWGQNRKDLGLASIFRVLDNIIAMSYETIFDSIDVDLYKSTAAAVSATDSELADIINSYSVAAKSAKTIATNKAEKAKAAATAASKAAAAAVNTAAKDAAEVAANIAADAAKAKAQYASKKADDLAAVKAAKAVTATVNAAAYAVLDVVKANTTDAKIAAAAVAVSAANAAEYAFGKNSELSVAFKTILLKDIAEFQKKKLDSFNNDISIYLDIWLNFIEDLTKNGCEYWANLYENIFENSFQKSETFLASLEYRIRVPDELYDKGAAVVAGYLKNAEEQGLVYIKRETRLIILGSAFAGKTTLVRRLNGDLSYPDPKESTHGVDTTTVLDLNGIKTHVWDFGGQMIYHTSHRCFITENCVYVLVINARSEEHKDINRMNYWLDTIRVYSKNKAKVFIVFNQSDDREQNIDDFSSMKDGEYKSLIYDIYGFNIDDMTSVNGFKNELTRYIEAIGHQTIGKNDNMAVEAIKALFEDNIQIIETENLEELLKDNGVKTKEDQKRAIDLFNILGIALNYPFMESYVLDPYWISHGVYKVVDYLQKNKSMFINYNELDDVFSDERSKYPSDKSFYVLDLMKYHKIGFSEKDGLHGLTVPCAATLTIPKEINVLPELDSLIIKIDREDHQAFPADFFYRYMCANEEDIQKYGEKMAIWQTGMVLARDKASALVELKNDTLIEITVWGESKKEYSKKLENLMKELLKEYRFTSYKNRMKTASKPYTLITLVLEAVSTGIGKGIAKGTIENIISS